MYKKTKKAFTLVELIIVIAIIAILAVSAFLVLTKWIAKSRDSRRINDLATIRDALNISSVESTSLPGPVDALTVQYTDGTSKIISKQGEFGVANIQSINLKGDLKDPSDADYYTYAVDGNNANYALMAMLEGSEESAYVGAESVYADVDYLNRKPRIEGSKIGLFVETSTNKPIEKAGTSGPIELAGSTAYKAYLSNTETVTENFVVLRGGPDSSLSLYAYYPFISGSTANDVATATAKNLTAAGTASEGKVGSGMTIPTTAATATLDINTDKPFTIMFWGSGLAGNIVSLLASNGSGFAITGTTSALTVYASGFDTSNFTNTVSESSSSFVQIAIVVNPTEDKIYIYTNGSLKSPKAFAGDIDIGSATLSIGGAAAAGRIDELRVYERGLSDTEIKSLYDAEK